MGAVAHRKTLGYVRVKYAEPLRKLHKNYCSGPRYYDRHIILWEPFFTVCTKSIIPTLNLIEINPI